MFSVHWPISGIISIKLPDGERMKLFSEGDDFIPTQAFWKGFGGYEGNSEYLFYTLAKNSQSIIDVGANIGYYTLIAAIANKNSKVYAFEPVGKIYDRLLKQIKINRLNNIIAETLVVSNNCEPIKLYIPELQGISNAASTKKGWVTKTKEEILPAVTLDQYKIQQRIPKIDLIKMDCEFHEKEVLEGMSEILKKDKPLIFAEVLFYESKGVKGHFDYSQAKEIEAILKKNGYYFYLI